MPSFVFAVFKSACDMRGMDLSACVCVCVVQQVDAVIAASKSVLASEHLKKVFEVILAVGNYMNSSKRGGAYGFKLQSLDIVSHNKFKEY